MEPDGGRTIRFGTFEADPAAGELRRAGRRVALQDQPFRLLILLLERPGKVVARDEIRRKLWGDTFIDFEEGVNTAVRKLRDALGDSASNPRFVETLPRRGYRFIAPVEVLGGRDSPPKSGNAEAPRDARPPRRFRWIPLAAVVLFIAGALFLARAWLDRKPVLTLSAPTQITRDAGLNTDPVISRDGGLIAYSSDRGGEGNLDIWVQHFPGGEPRRLTNDPADDHEPDISPEGSQIVFRSERDRGGVYSISVLGGAPRLLIPGAYVPRFSPDGTRIAYARGTFGTGSFVGELFVHDLATGTMQALAPDTSTLGPAAWSPDGKFLAFVGESFRGKPQGIYVWVCSTAGGPATPLSIQPISGTRFFFGQLRTVSVAWFRDQIILSMNQGDGSNLWVGSFSPGTHRLASDLKRITVGSGNEVMPFISANGRLVFASRIDSANIWEANPAKPASAMRRITNDRARNVAPSISADGSKLAYVSDRNGNFDVWLKDLINDAETVVARTPTREVYVAISRDGSQIASWDGYDTYITPSLGGTPRLLCNECGRPDDWTPDGALILWVRGVGTQARDSTTGQFTQLVTDQASPPVAPALSPDGKWIVFHILKEGSKSDVEKRTNSDNSALPMLRQIFLAPNEGRLVTRSDWIPVTDGKGLDREPRWSGDGNRIYFLSDRDGFRCIWARDLDPKSKQPRGSPYPALHLHDARLSLSHIANTGQVGICARGENLIFSMGELTGNIWTAELRYQ
jgi:Tol biopolymer transport system component/DNA-binding winged helix-turn-helix (wHTH) protein